MKGGERRRISALSSPLLILFPPLILLTSPPFLRSIPLIKTESCTQWGWQSLNNRPTLWFPELLLSHKEKFLPERKQACQAGHRIEVLSKILSVQSNSCAKGAYLFPILSLLMKYYWSHLLMIIDNLIFDCLIWLDKLLLCINFCFSSQCRPIIRYLYVDYFHVHSRGICIWNFCPLRPPYCYNILDRDIAPPTSSPEFSIDSSLLLQRAAHSSYSKRL